LTVNCIETGIPGLLIIEPDVYGDSRGYFMETWHAQRYAQAGLPEGFTQANVSRSSAGVIRGLHYQYPEPQGKLVQVIEGRIFDVAVDIRSDSPTFRQWAGVELTAENHRQFYVPEGFAHGFCVLGKGATISYLCTRVFSAENDAAIAWNDPDIGVEWPVAPQSLSAKDLAAPRLRDVPKQQLPRLDNDNMSRVPA
jgi:dTDP-4-dehydrorhamnose 3,5-epimerase